MAHRGGYHGGAQSVQGWAWGGGGLTVRYGGRRPAAVTTLGQAAVTTGFQRFCAKSQVHMAASAYVASHALWLPSGYSV